MQSGKAPRMANRVLVRTCLGIQVRACLRARGERRWPHVRRRAGAVPQARHAARLLQPPGHMCSRNRAAMFVELLAWCCSVL